MFIPPTGVWGFQWRTEETPSVDCLCTMPWAQIIASQHDCTEMKTIKNDSIQNRIMQNLLGLVIEIMRCYINFNCFGYVEKY